MLKEFYLKTLLQIIKAILNSDDIIFLYVFDNFRHFNINQEFLYELDILKKSYHIFQP